MTMTSESFLDFIAYYRTHRDHIPFEEKIVFDRLIEDREPERFVWGLTEYEDYTILRVNYGPDHAREKFAVNVYPDKTYVIYHEQDAVDKLEQMLNDGDLGVFNHNLTLCVNALLGIVEDGRRAKLFLNLALDRGVLQKFYAEAFDEMISIEY